MRTLTKARHRPIWLLAYSLSLACAAETISNNASAEVENANGLDQPAAIASAKELQTLERFLNLSDSELERIQILIQRIQSMDAIEKEAFRAKIDQYCKLEPQEREALRHGWGKASQEYKIAWRTMMQSLTPQERAAIHEEMQLLKPTERFEYREALVQRFLESQNPIKTNKAK